MTAVAASVQAHATRRNEHVEVLVDFVLREFVEKLREGDYLEGSSVPIRFARFEREDCQDVFDHFLELDLRKPVGELEGRMQVWAQTTCYKGNVAGRPEANKTYEIRETLIEALGLRRWLMEEGIPLRTFHFTVGPATYTYGWFPQAKEAAFDRSLYLQSDDAEHDIFDELAALFSGIHVEADLRTILSHEYEDPASFVGRIIRTSVQSLSSWFAGGADRCRTADLQAQLLRRLSNEQRKSADRAVDAAAKGGANIKGRAIEALSDGLPSDDTLRRTLHRIKTGNPFLDVALEADDDWSSWCDQHFHVPANGVSLERYLEELWTASAPPRLINRRLLVRIHSDGHVPYVQDSGIAGLTEHNLYNGNHTDVQVRAVVEWISGLCRDAGIDTAHKLRERLRGPRGRTILRVAKRAEAANGTAIRPSFIYLEEALRDEFDFVSFDDARLPAPVPYHRAFGDARVNPYQNMKVILGRDAQPLAIVKAKYFNGPEFARRAKEEAYVGLTTKYAYSEEQFEERYPGLPLVMFVDMAPDLKPPTSSIRRLAYAGWEVFFSVAELNEFLHDLESSAR